MRNINRQELIELITQDNNCSKKTAEEAINMFVGGIKRGLSSADKVTVIGFGSFYKQHRKAGKGHNPRTGEEINIAASVLPRFKAGKALKDVCK